MLIEQSNEVLENVVLSEEQLLINDLHLELLDSQISESLSELADMTRSLEIYQAISDTITKCGGVTKSLETMFGENFSSASSMEGETMDKIKAGAKVAYNKIKELIKKLIDWVKGLFKKNQPNLKTLEDLAKKYGDVDLKDERLIFIEHAHTDKDEWTKYFRQCIMSLISDGNKYHEKDLAHFGLLIPGYRFMKYYFPITVTQYVKKFLDKYKEYHDTILDILKEFESIVNSGKFKTRGYTINGNKRKSFSPEQREELATKRQQAIPKALAAIHKAAARIENLPAIAARALKMTISKKLRETEAQKADARTTKDPEVID